MIHVWLLVSFRHYGAGLPSKSLQPVFILFVLSSALCTARFDANHGGVQFVLSLFTGAYISPRFACGLALLSLGIDVLAIALPWAAKVLNWWEAIASVAFAVRYVRAKRKGIF